MKLLYCEQAKLKTFAEIQNHLIQRNSKADLFPVVQSASAKNWNLNITMVVNHTA